MADQDPHPESIVGDFGHRTMAVTVKAGSATDNDKMIGAVGGTDADISTGYGSGVEWNDKTPLIEINDENVTIHQTPVASSTPVPVSTESEMFLPPELPRGKKPCVGELTTAWLLKSMPPLCLKPDYSDAELMGYTWPPLTNVIPWIKYEAQNMMEPTWRQELHCIKEDDHV